MAEYEIACFETYATFVLIGKKSDSKNISNLLNIELAHSKIIDLSGKIRTTNQDHWEITTQNTLTSKELSDHLEWLLNNIELKKDKLIAIINNYKNTHMYIYCFWKPTSGYGGPSLSSDILKRIADLNLELWLDFNP